MRRPGIHLACVATAAAVLLAGCHHAPARVAAPPPPAIHTGPVMVSVPPPTHRSSPDAEAISVSNDIPVVKPVAPPKKIVRHTAPPVPSSAPAAVPQTASAAPPAAVNLGELTAGDDNLAASRDNAAQALRTQRDRFASLSTAVQNAHPAEVEQARRYLKSGADSFRATDYAATLSLATKTRVLLDDLLK